MPSIVSAAFALDMDEVHREASTSSGAAAPLSCSPNKIRLRIDAAKEQAKVVNSVYKEGEVIHWMSVRSPELVEFGRSLEKRGFNTLGSIAFLTEDEFDLSLSAPLKHTLLTALAHLRHDLYRM